MSRTNYAVGACARVMTTERKQLSGRSSLCWERGGREQVTLTLCCHIVVVQMCYAQSTTGGGQSTTGGGHAQEGAREKRERGKCCA